jgi:hypothetical protein
MNDGCYEGKEGAKKVWRHDFKGDVNGFVR